MQRTKRDKQSVYFSQRVLICCWLAAISVVKLNLNFINIVLEHAQKQIAFLRKIFFQTPVTVYGTTSNHGWFTVVTLARFAMFS